MNRTELGADRLLSDLKLVVRDAEDLLRATAGDVGEKAREARAKLSATLESAKKSCGRWEESAVAGAQAADQFVRAHPYEAIGLGVGIGVIIGVLLSRR